MICADPSVICAHSSFQHEERPVYVIRHTGIGITVFFVCKPPTGAASGVVSSVKHDWKR